MIQRLPKHVGRGSRLPTTECLCTSITIPPELHAEIRECAIKEGRSFSNMIVTLAKRGMKVKNVSLD